MRDIFDIGGTLVEGPTPRNPAGVWLLGTSTGGAPLSSVDAVLLRLSGDVVQLVVKTSAGNEFVYGTFQTEEDANNALALLVHNIANLLQGKDANDGLTSEPA
jgi:hypothetical protein